ncbi:MAG: ATP-binding protein, partial [Gammaproteobacteria bacterium]|nr:ATP-binding protein [Gammaproteobacteria bacterium]
RALSNLLSNAIRHTAAGETVRVLLDTKESGETSIVVESPGVEIATDQLAKLFDRFYRVDPSRHQSEAGTGLGLAIVKSIVEAHGGEIDVTSASQITRFRITLPTKS